MPLDSSFVPTLRRYEIGTENAFRWRLHGQHPSPNEYETALWSCLCNFVIVVAGRPIGLVSAYDQDHTNGHCKLAALKFNANGAPSAAMARGGLLLVDYLFQGWPFRKIYIETTGYNYGQFARRHDRYRLKEEGRLREHVYLSGIYHDLVVLSLYRHDWYEVRSRLLTR